MALLNGLDRRVSLKIGNAFSWTFCLWNVGKFDAMGFGDAMLELHWKKGEEELRKALRLMPQDATIRQHLGLVLLCEGRFS